MSAQQIQWLLDHLPDVACLSGRQSLRALSAELGWEQQHLAHCRLVRRLPDPALRWILLRLASFWGLEPPSVEGTSP